MPRRPRAAVAVLLLTCFSTRILAEDHRLLAKLPGPSGTTVEFSRDGKLILTAGGDEARVWDAETFKPVTGPLIPQNGKKLAFACLSADGKRVVTAAGMDVVVWDVPTGTPGRAVRHAAQVATAALRRDGRVLITAGDDRAAVVWNMDKGERLLVLRHPAPVYFTCFSPDGAKVLTVAVGDINDPVLKAMRGAVYLWDARTGKQLMRKWTDDVAKPGLARWRRRVAFSPDGRCLAWIFSGNVGILRYQQRGDHLLGDGPCGARGDERVGVQSRRTTAPYRQGRRRARLGRGDG